MRSVGRANESLTALGLGTFLTFDLLPGSNRDHLRDITRQYMEAGVGVIDTSPLYGTGETSVGNFLGATRSGPPATSSPTKVMPVRASISRCCACGVRRST
jgi:aryl-alcohol dehydrogenase-like predicted oxidoreductase